MRGLLVKDLQLAFSNKTIIPIFIFITVMLLITGDEERISFVVGYFTMLCGMLTISTVGYDDSDHSGAYLLTMPITRKLYVFEKYVFAFLGTFVGWFLSFLMGYVFIIVRNYNVNFVEMIVSSLGVALVLYVVLGIFIPIQLKFGNEKSRIALIVLIAIVLLIGAGGKALLEKMNVNYAKSLQEASKLIGQLSFPILAVIAVTLMLVLTGITALISKRIMEKKQF